MTPVPYIDVFRALGAEAVLVVTAFVALTLDLASFRRSEISLRRRNLGATE
jgi:hypothetical protein